MESSDLKRHSFKNKVMEIVTELEPFFKNKKRSTNSEQARFISLQNLDIKTFDTSETVTQVLVNIDLQTDVDRWQQDIMIRQFAHQEEFEEEMFRYSQLEERCLLFQNVDPINMIHIDKAKLRVVYDLDETFPLNEYDIVQDEVDYVFGRITAIIQGVDAQSLAHTSLRQLLEYMLDYLPFSQDEKDKLGMLLEPHFPILDFTKGGYIPVTVFDPTTIRVRFDSDNYFQGNFQIFIQLFSPEEQTIDRMTDVAVVFAKRAYQEFKSTGGLAETRQSINLFFKGYNTISEKLGKYVLTDFYPHGITLDLQMLITFFLIELQNTESQPFSEPDALRYIYFLLLKKPFLLF